MKDLLEAGVHFGHQTKRWNPKMKEYIFGERNGIYILDLGKTVNLFKDTVPVIRHDGKEDLRAANSSDRVPIRFSATDDVGVGGATAPSGIGLP